MVHLFIRGLSKSLYQREEGEQRGYGRDEKAFSHSIFEHNAIKSIGNVIGQILLFVSVLLFRRLFSEFQGIFACVLFENAVEMALVRESGQIGDLRQAMLRFIQQINCPLNSKFTNVVAER